MNNESNAPLTPEERADEPNVIARWNLFEVFLEDVGGEVKMAGFAVGDEKLTILGAEEEFLKRIAKHLYKNVHVEIVVRSSND